jgi:hypothetical protein
MSNRPQPGVQHLDVDLGADDGGTGLSEADLGFHQLALEGFEFSGGGSFSGSVIHG